MSASYIRQCKCGLEYVVEEFEFGYVCKVDGVVEQDCPKCDAPLTVDGGEQSVGGDGW